jgi:5-oxoprolinase (ATP-hydrolysing)
VHDHGGTLRFFTASRGHHSDVGGIQPGSMPPTSTRLEEEGVILRALPIVEGGRFLEAEVRAALTSARWPARDPNRNIADLQAQIAANRTGARLLAELADRSGLEVVLAYMEHVQRNAAAEVAAAIAALPDGTRHFADGMDDGSVVSVSITVAGDRMIIDFDGTRGQHPGNLNAPRAVTVAAVIYVLRTLVGIPIPLNSGCFAPIELRIPRGSLLDPEPGAAVVAGNVETSQRIVDVLLGALGLAAASQGTMNNLTFGTHRFGYYETIAGGAGATPRRAGASAVHTHMTNTRLTDAEILEADYPVRVRELSIRVGSGGTGRHRGGDGVIREIELLEAMDVSVLSDRRLRRPFGLAGGEAGLPGRNFLDGAIMPGSFQARARAGARLRIETPGGGGYGRA